MAQVVSLSVILLPYLSQASKSEVVGRDVDMTNMRTKSVCQTLKPSQIRSRKPEQRAAQVPFREEQSARPFPLSADQPYSKRFFPAKFVED